MFSVFAKVYVLMRGYFSAGVIPDETKALSLLAPANAVAGLLPGGGLLPTPNPLTQVLALLRSSRMGRKNSQVSSSD